MLALHHAADSVPLTFRTLQKPLGFLPFPSCPWACTRARQAPSWAHGLPPSNTAGRSVDMAQSKKSVLCLGISWGIMASQATRITAYDVGSSSKTWRKKYEKYFVQFACDRWEIFLVPERKYFCHPKIFYVWPQIFFLKVEILRKILKKKIGKILRVTAALTLRNGSDILILCPCVQCQSCQYCTADNLISCPCDQHQYCTANILISYPCVQRQ